MKSDNWKKISEILPDCLEMSVSERRKYLDELHLSPELRSEIEEFLAFETEAEDFLSATADGVAKDFFPRAEFAENPPVGQLIGIYKTEKEIGFGGMGAVYLAARSDGKFEQKVAIKMLKREFNVERIRRNFTREKEIQSKLNHPNIVTLLDAGTTADGVPYLVMEYVEGLPIDKFCKEKNLPLKARLKLFNKVCDAVSFAHRNLIIHRDLKPSNILVNEKGEPKLLDFGISKLLGAEQTEDKPTITMLGAMTPEYASPEQIKGETITTATDIYSLGMVLYKILTGKLPYNFDGKTNGELLRAITEDEPTAPSAISNFKSPIANQDQKSKTADRLNRQSPIANRKFLKGDVDNIILKALRKEPARRYKTVEQFSADIWRHLDGLPVSARPATVSYRAAKFFKRNRIPVIAAFLIVCSLLAGMTVAVWQAKAATESQQKAEIENQKAQKISNFMFKVIAYANPAWYAEGAKFDGNARVIDVLDDLSDKIDAEFEGQADVQSELHHKFAEVYIFVSQRKNDPVRTENFAQKLNFHALRALELRKQFYGTRHELVAKDLFYAYTIIGKNDREQAELLAEAIEMMRETNPKNLNLPYMFEAYTVNLIMPEYAEKHEIYRKAARPATDENKYAIAERYLREALPIFRFHYKADNSAIFSNECRLAYALARQENRKDFDEHFGICKQGEEKLKGTKLSETFRKNVVLIEQVLTGKPK